MARRLDTGQVRARSQAGFTLLELLVVIAVLGVLSGVATFSVGRFRAKAQQVALDQSLNAVSTAVEAKMILENITNLTDLDAATLDVRNTEGIDFVAFDINGGSATVQARFKDTDEPCRQIHFPGSTPGPCDPTDGKQLFPFTPGSAISGSELADGPGPVDEQLAKSEADKKDAAGKATQDKAADAQDASGADSAKGTLDEKKDGKKDGDSTPTDEELKKAEELKKYLAELKAAEDKATQDKAAEEKATQNKAAQDKAAKDKAGSSSKTRSAGLELASSASDLIPGTWKWNKRDGRKVGAGKWLAMFEFNNTWRYDQKITVVGVRREVHDGRRSSSSFEQVGVVPAGSLTHLKVESDLSVTLNKSGGISKEDGVVSVELTEVKVETTDEHGRATTYRFSLTNKPVQAKYPSNLGS